MSRALRWISTRCGTGERRASLLQASGLTNPARTLQPVYLSAPVRAPASISAADVSARALLSGAVTMVCDGRLLRSSSARNVTHAQLPFHLVPAGEAAAHPSLATAVAAGGEPRVNALQYLLVLSVAEKGKPRKVNLPRKSLRQCSLRLLPPEEQHGADPVTVSNFAGALAAYNQSRSTQVAVVDTCASVDAIFVSTEAISTSKREYTPLLIRAPLILHISQLYGARLRLAYCPRSRQDGRRCKAASPSCRSMR